MFIELCKELDFPEESLSDLNDAYLCVTENPETKKLMQAAIEGLASNNQVWFDDARDEIIKITDLNRYVLEMVIAVSAFERISQNYKAVGLTENFEKHKATYRSKLISCKEKLGVWGINDAFWQSMVHELYSVRLGRLRYEPFHHFIDVPYKHIKRGDPIVLLHIPSGSPLDTSEVMDSLKLAYEHFKDRFDGDTVPFVTETWLLYPPFLNGVFKEGGNTQRFAALFDIIDQSTTGFADFSYVFKCAYPGEDLSALPQNTSLQRNMLEFIKQGNVMGRGYGIFLYNQNGIVSK